MTGQKPWRLFTRKSRWRRRIATRGEQYDGSRWVLKKRYDSKELAEKARDLLLSRMSESFPMSQFKIMHQDEGRP